MLNITLFYEKKSDEAETLITELEKLKEEFAFSLFQIDIQDDPVVFEKYKNKTPVLIVGPYTLTNPINVRDLRVSLGAAKDRNDHLNQITDKNYQKKLSQSKKATNSDRLGYWFSKHFMLVFNLIIFLYVGLPFLAPVLMKTGLTGPGKLIYTIYSPLCHQLAFRSWFLFGEQGYYPRAVANISGVETYEQISGQQTIDILEARKFIGNEQLGYKVALCERDIAIYGAILLFGIIFALSKNRFKPIPWYIWIVVGLVPIGFDGVSQLPGLMANVPEWLPLRESTPFLRSLTGGLFGLTTAWYLFPLIEFSMHETREILFRKISIDNANQVSNR